MVSLINALGLGLLAAATAALPSGQKAALAPETEQSLAMRASWEAPTPRGDARIYVRSVGVHHVRTEQSTIAWRDREGAWSISRMVQDGPGGLLAIEKRLTLKEEARLPAAEGQRLDKLLRSPALYMESARRTGTPGVALRRTSWKSSRPPGTPSFAGMGACKAGWATWPMPCSAPAAERRGRNRPQFL